MHSLCVYLLSPDCRVVQTSELKHTARVKFTVKPNKCKCCNVFDPCGQLCVNKVVKSHRYHDEWHEKPKFSHIPSIRCGMFGMPQLVFRNNKIAEPRHSQQILKNSFHAVMTDETGGLWEKSQNLTAHKNCIPEVILIGYHPKY